MQVSFTGIKLGVQTNEDLPKNKSGRSNLIEELKIYMNYFKNDFCPVARYNSLL